MIHLSWTAYDESWIIHDPKGPAEKSRKNIIQTGLHLLHLSLKRQDDYSYRGVEIDLVRSSDIYAHSMEDITWVESKISDDGIRTE